MSLPINTTNNLQIKKKGEGKRCKISAILALGWCSELDLMVPGWKKKDDHPLNILTQRCGFGVNSKSHKLVLNV